MIGQIWRWLKRLFQSLFGKASQTQSGRLKKKYRGDREELPPLTDTDYEFLFGQLLDGVAYGWHEGRIVKFFAQLGERGKQDRWVAWLERFGQKVLASPVPNQQLGIRMVRLGEQSQSIHSISRIGETAYNIGRQLLTRDSDREIWEYSGPDLETVNSVETLPASVKDDRPQLEKLSADLPSEAIQGEQITIDQLFTMLQQDPNLVQLMAQQLGIETNDPQDIIQTLIDQLHGNAPVENPTDSEEVASWFNLGLQQAEAGDFASAIASWEKAIELQPNLAQAWHNRGSALGNLGRLEEAIASFDRALEINPNDFQAWNDRGTALYNIQQYPEALASWERVIDLQPDYYLAWYNRGLVLENFGRDRDALESYNKALEIQPDFQPAIDRRNNLQ
jgi:tetratricopeptide (TPR) repeat protein